MVPIYCCLRYNNTRCVFNIKIDVFVSVGGSTTRFICKDLSIPPNSAVELVSGGAKFVMQSTDVLKVESDTASSADVYVSVVDAISA